MLYMKGLEGVIGVSIAHPVWGRTKPEDPKDQHIGWFLRGDEEPVQSALGRGSFLCKGAIPDHINHAKTIRELYEKADPNYNGRYSVPVLWCKQESTIVCNESAIIMEILNTAFNDFARFPEVDMFPVDLEVAQREATGWVSSEICEGVYKCGFAKTQEDYTNAFHTLFAALDRLEALLSTQRYICGPRATGVDLRAFLALLRFDEVYFVYFKCNKKMIRFSYPNLFNFVKDVYQWDNVARSVNMEHIKMTYYTAHPDLNTFAIVPIGAPDDWASPHDRHRFQ
uniref:Uncharacterized protein n=1 Tax=Arcella intermedia TaxID=1963864 RepID=A0A6B2LAT6_9EUKA